MNTVKAEAICLLGALASQTFALQLDPGQWGFAVLLLVAGGLFGATIAAYAGKRIGLEETVDNLFGKILLNVAAVGVFGPSALTWWMHWTDASMVEAALLVGGVIAMIGVSTLVIIIPKFLALMKRLDIVAVLGKIFPWFRPAAPPQKPPATTDPAP